MGEVKLCSIMKVICIHCTCSAYYIKGGGGPTAPFQYLSQSFALQEAGARGTYFVVRTIKENINNGYNATNIFCAQLNCNLSEVFT